MIVTLLLLTGFIFVAYSIFLSNRRDSRMISSLCRRTSGLIIGAGAVSFWLLFGGCISDQGSFNNIEIKGYVRSLSDSSAVPGALVMAESMSSGSVMGGEESSGDGYYEIRWTSPTGNWNPVEYRVTVADIDGQLNGIFISQDTVVYNDNSEHEVDIIFDVDFFVEMVDDTTALFRQGTGSQTVCRHIFSGGYGDHG